MAQLCGCGDADINKIYDKKRYNYSCVDSICAALCYWQGCDGTPAAGLLIRCCAVLSLARRASTMALPR